MKYSPYQLDAIELFASRHKLSLRLKPFAERVISFINRSTGGEVWVGLLVIMAWYGGDRK